MSEDFLPLNPFEEVDIYRINLPHWRQQGVTYFVTWRLADSLPQSKLNDLQAEREAWFRAHRIRTKQELETLPTEQRHEYHRVFTTRLHQWLDAGMGNCELPPELPSCSITRQMNRKLDTFQRW